MAAVPRFELRIQIVNWRCVYLTISLLHHEANSPLIVRKIHHEGIMLCVVLFTISVGRFLTTQCLANGRTRKGKRVDFSLSQVVSGRGHAKSLIVDSVETNPIFVGLAKERYLFNLPGS